MASTGASSSKRGSSPGKQCVVDVDAPLVANEQALEVMQPGEGALDDPAVAAQPRAVLGLAASDQRLDPTLPDHPSVLLVVVAAVSDQAVWPPARSTTDAGDRWHRVEKRDQLRDVVAVAARNRRDPNVISPPRRRSLLDTCLRVAGT